MAAHFNLSSMDGFLKCFFISRRTPAHGNLYSLVKVDGVGGEQYSYSYTTVKNVFVESCYVYEIRVCVCIYIYVHISNLQLN
jgi:hypothetical protein